jgi:glycosyltransferase involved in cell wall biosynthesis
MISIVIIVKNDRGIKDTLNKLESIKKPSAIEIIVVDASEKNQLIDIKNKYPKVKWITYESNKNKDTRPEQRNIGIKKAKGEIMVFIDASCTPLDNWLEEIVKPFKKENENFVAGLVKAKKGVSVHDVGWQKRSNKKYIKDCPTMNFAFRESLIK